MNRYITCSPGLIWLDLHKQNTVLTQTPKLMWATISSVQSIHSVKSNSLWPHELQYTRPLRLSPLPEFTQTHVHYISDAIQPSHPLLSPSPPAFNLSQHQGLFQWVRSLHQVAKVLEFQLQHQSFQWIFRAEAWWLMAKCFLYTKKWIFSSWCV